MDRARPHAQLAECGGMDLHTPTCYDLLMIPQLSQKVKEHFCKEAFLCGCPRTRLQVTNVDKKAMPCYTVSVPYQHKGGIL